MKRVVFKYNDSLDLRNFREAAHITAYEIHLAKKHMVCNVSEKTIELAKQYNLELVDENISLIKYH